MAHIPRLYVAGHITAGPIALGAEQSRRLSAVMRVREGDEFRLFSGDGREWRARVASVTKAGVRAQIEDVVRYEAPAGLVVEAWVGLVRPNRIDWAIEKCTEAGVDVIRPLLSEHSARGEGSSAQRQERWNRIVIEAAEQCGRLSLPVVEAPAKFEDLLRRHHGALIIADANGRPAGEVNAMLPERGLVAVAIGPEGGFAETELAAAKARGALGMTLGLNILRTETAALVAVALLRSAAKK